MRYFIFLLSLLLSFPLFGQLNGAATPSPTKGSGVPTPISSTPITRGTPSLPTRPNPTLTPPPTNPGDRVVFWLHGLGGSGGPSGTWSRAAEATETNVGVADYSARKITSDLPTYSQLSINGAGQSLHNQLVLKDALSAANSSLYVNNIIVAHSQGGFAARSADRLYHQESMISSRRFGGVVTFGTAHRGAMVINNESQVAGFVREGCTALGTAQVLDAAIFDNTILDFIIPNQALSAATSAVCNFAVDKVLPLISGDKNSPIRLQYRVGHPQLDSLNSFVSGTPYICFYGIEQSPEFYRVMYNQEVKEPNDFDYFEANPDDSLVIRVSNMIANYWGNYYSNKLQVEVLENMGLPCTTLDWITKPLFCTEWDALYWQKRDKMRAWFDGYWWLTGSNLKYLSIIGAAKTVTTVTNTCQCSGYTYPTTSSTCALGCQFVPGTTITSSTVVSPNDGVVLASSANFGAITDDMPLSNHLQMRNDINTKICLNGVWDGVYHPFFKTDKR